MATSTLPSASALEQNENGWEVTVNGDRPTVIHANGPGWNRIPSWPDARRVSTVVLSRSGVTRSTVHGRRRIRSGRTTRTHTSSQTNAAVMTDHSTCFQRLST